MCSAYVRKDLSAFNLNRGLTLLSLLQLQAWDLARIYLLQTSTIKMRKVSRHWFLCLRKTAHTLFFRFLTPIFVINANCPTFRHATLKLCRLRDNLAVSDGVLYTHGPPVLMVVATRLCKLLRPTNLCSHLLEGLPTLKGITQVTVSASLAH